VDKFGASRDVHAQWIPLLEAQRQWPELAQALAANGRENTTPLVQRFFAAQMAAGRLRRVDAADAMETFIGLLVGDLQVRLLWGMATPPDAVAIKRRAQRAAERFVVLFGA
jgi:hypothetical protein